MRITTPSMTVLLAMFVCCAAWLGGGAVRGQDLPLEPTAAQLSTAREAFEKLGGKYVHNGQYKVHLFMLTGTAATDDNLKNLPSVPFAFGLHVNGPVTDIGLKHAAKHMNLQWLGLFNSKVTEAELIVLGNLPKLHHLLLEGVPVTDGGLQTIADLKTLRSLNLSLTKVTGMGLKKLDTLKDLEELNLNGAAGLTDEGLKELKALPKLNRLDLVGTRVTDAGMKNLAPLSSLQVLVLNSTRITDAGLIELKALDQLREVQVLFTKVTEPGVQALKKALPKCNVLHE